MGAEFKPGDVAMVGYRIYEDSDLVEDVRVLGADNKWRGAHGWVANDPAVALSIRPVLIIDPESDADVARLCDAHKSVDHAVGTMPMQAALRSLITPPPSCPSRLILDGDSLPCLEAEGHAGLHETARFKWGAES